MSVVCKVEQINNVFEHILSFLMYPLVFPSSPPSSSSWTSVCRIWITEKLQIALVVRVKMRSFTLAKRKKKHKTKRRREDIERFSSKLPLSDNSTSFPNNAAAAAFLLLFFCSSLVIFYVVQLLKLLFFAMVDILGSCQLLYEEDLKSQKLCFFPVETMEFLLQFQLIYYCNKKL